MKELTEQELNAWLDNHLFNGGQFVGLKKRGLWWRPKSCGYTSVESEAGRYTREEAQAKANPHYEPVTVHEFSVPNYTTDPAAAMLVLEKCLGFEGCSIEITTMSDGSFRVRRSDKLGVKQFASTMPESICRFAYNLFQ